MTRFPCLLALVLAAFSLSATSWAQTEIQIAASKDNTLYQNNAGAFSNGLGHFLFAGLNNHSEARRGLIAFDLNGKFPPGAKILSAKLTLNLSKTISGPQTVVLHRVLAGWGEGASDAGGEEGGGADAMPGDATWSHTFFNTHNWSNLGGDFSPTASATLVVSVPNFYTWESTPEMVADVQSWLDAPTSNFGWLLMGNESVKGGTKRFDSLQNPVAAQRPVLRVIYSTASRVVAEEASSPRSYVLAQNYPNPFNPSTTIRFELPVAEEVALVIYNTHGQSVRQLAKGKFARSAHQVMWDGRDDAGASVTSGIYIYRLETANFTAARKLALVR